MTIAELKLLKETEHKVEFKEAKTNFPFAGGSHQEQHERRKCFLGYLVALANERGGILVLGMTDSYPHVVVGTDFASGKLGALEDEVYNRLFIRVKTEELFEENLRVVVIHVPSRPIGKMLKFEGVPLMRVGGSLRNMSDEEMFAILSEQEPDFSEKICPHITLDDMDPQAIRNLKNAYSKKQSNSAFLSIEDKQALSDLGLIRDEGLTYAALILLGREEIIAKYLPQSAIHIE